MTFFQILPISESRLFLSYRQWRLSKCCRRVYQLGMRPLLYLINRQSWCFCSFLSNSLPAEGRWSRRSNKTLRWSILLFFCSTFGIGLSDHMIRWILNLIRIQVLWQYRIFIFANRWTISVSYFTLRKNSRFILSMTLYFSKFNVFKRDWIIFMG